MYYICKKNVYSMTRGIEMRLSHGVQGLRTREFFEINGHGAITEEKK